MNPLARLAPAALLLLGFPGLAPADEWIEEYPLTGRPSLVLRASDAAIRVETWNQQRVAVRVVTTGWQIPGEVEIEDRSSGNRVDITVREPAIHLSFGWERRRILVEVKVPARADVDAQTSDGAIVLPALEGTIRAKSSDGSITLDGAKGAFMLATSDGRITARDVDGTLDARASDGWLTIDGRFDILRLATSDGHIRAAVAPGSVMRDDWSLSTTDGSVVLRLPEGLAADLVARVGDGVIDVDLPVTTRGTWSGHDFEGTLNGGGRLLSLRTGDGSIRITR